MNSENTRLPERKYMDDSRIKWRFGNKPDFSKVDQLWANTKSRSHASGSLEAVVENLVKTWEMEASHKIDPNDWGAIVKDVYQISANDNIPVKLDTAMEIGNYNILLKDQSPLYDASQKSFEESHDIFKTTFNGGFPWEVLKVYSGPPRVIFDWRHWAYVTGEYTDSKGEAVTPSNKLVEMFGYCIVTVNNELKIEEIKVYYNPNPFLEALEYGNATEEGTPEKYSYEMSNRCPFSQSGKKFTEK